MIAFTLPEIRRLLINIVLQMVDAIEHVRGLVDLARRRQHQARLSRYKRRGYPLT